MECFYLHSIQSEEISDGISFLKVVPWSQRWLSIYLSLPTKSVHSLAEIRRIFSLIWKGQVERASAQKLERRLKCQDYCWLSLRFFPYFLNRYSALIRWCQQNKSDLCIDSITDFYSVISNLYNILFQHSIKIFSYIDMQNFE